jgi:hypothetical protein
VASSQARSVAQDRLLDRGGAEVQALDRYALVRGVEETLAAEAGGHAHGDEPVGADPEPREVASVGAARREPGHGNTLRVGLAHDRPQRLEERPQLRLRLRGPHVQLLQLDLRSDHRAQLRAHVLGTEAREQAAVQIERDLARDDVDLRAALDDGRADRVVEDGVEARSFRTERLKHNVSAGGVEKRAQVGAHLAVRGGAHVLEHHPDRRRHVHGQAVLV